MNRREKCTIYITGAGPGDPSLLTLKAKEVLEKSDVLVYDTLVSEEILEYIFSLNPNIKFIYVGKKPYEGDKSESQERIHDLLLELSKDYNKICRLKGGDPSVFGRVGEEAEFLKKHNINFEIIPGISSVLGASAYAGIPLTHREVSSSFTVLTAHEDPDCTDCSIDWGNINLRNHTLVILMGTKNLPKIVDILLSNGENPNTPLAIIFRGTTPEQKTIISTLGEFNKKISEDSLHPPSLIIIGDVVSYKKEMNWFEKFPLIGKKILITRSKDQSFEFSKKLSSLGAKPIAMPIVSYEFNKDEIYNKQILQNLKDFEWIFFTSQNAVKFFFEVLEKNLLDSRALDKINIACVGDRTKLELKKYNINPDFTPKKFSTESLINELSEKEDLKTAKILYPTQKGNLRKTELQNIVYWEIYKSNFIDTLGENLISKINSGLDVMTFFSAKTCEQFYSLLKQHNLLGQIKSSKIAVIGDETAKSANALFGKVDIIAEPFTEDGLINSIQNCYSQVPSCKP